MYNTIEVMDLEIKKAEIKHFRKYGFRTNSMEGIRDVKILPYLSVVQSVEGSYDITLGRGKSAQTGEGGFFIAPSGIQQDIVHHNNKKSGRMICRWIFLRVEINNEYLFDSFYSFPTIPDEKLKCQLNSLFNDIFGTDDILENYSSCYKILSLLRSAAVPNKRITNEGIRNVLSYIENNYTDSADIKSLARIAKMSESNLYPAFKKQTGIPPMAYLNHYRLSIAADKLLESDTPINEISYSVGIKDPLYFSKLFKKSYGITPREYRNRKYEKIGLGEKKLP